MRSFLLRICHYCSTIIILSLPDWSDEAVSNAEILRLIYQGRFLHCNVTLSALGLATGKTTVMHLVPRENLPEPNSQGSYFNYKIRKTLYCFLSIVLLCSYQPVSNLLFYNLHTRSCHRITMCMPVECRSLIQSSIDDLCV